MEIFNIIAVLVTFAAVVNFLNYRYIKLPSTVGVLLISLVISILLMVLWSYGIGIEKQHMHALIGSINFQEVMLGVLLSLLLFAGALQVDYNRLVEYKIEIISLALFGVLLSTFIIGSLTYLIFNILDLNISYIYCLLFGALISPTDPIAVLGILKRLGIPKSLEIKIAGESLFNDGIGVVLFMTILEAAVRGGHVRPIAVVALFAREVAGGLVFGFVAGWMTYRMLKVVDDYKVEVLLTIALALGAYSLASSVHISGPLAIVVAGLLIGNHGRQFAMTEKTKEHLDNFWELVDEILNIILFLLIGLEVLVIQNAGKYFAIIVLVIPVVLSARFISVAIPIIIMKSFKRLTDHGVKILTWGGLRGGISVAMALSLPRGNEREVIVTMTYAVVIFSVLVQGLTINPLIKRLGYKHPQKKTP
jgi:CPA1 family monovalent cation:H+ antiporter